MSFKMLNLGCGSRYREYWTNVNFTTSGPGVIAANLGLGVPFPDNSFDVVYHSHVLEHFSKDAAPRFLHECYRVLRTGGVIRVVVPDLEAIAKTYLMALEKAKVGMKGWDCNHEWMLLELYDQVARNRSGGEMLRFLFRDELPNAEFVVGRCGLEVRNLIELGMASRARANLANMATSSFVRKVFRVLLSTSALRERLLRVFLGDEYEALQVGRFRLSGENHQWMYDCYSLGQLLALCGFKNIVVRSASESLIPEWTSFNLDTEPDGSVYKPDSLFIEAVKG